MTQSEAKRLVELEKEIKSEILEINKLERKLGLRSYELDYRRLEANFELFKVYFQEENRRYLSRGEYDRRKKEEFFRKSITKAKEIIELGKEGVELFQNKQDVSKFYFIMGQAANEVSYFDEAKVYLEKGLKTARDDDEDKQTNMITLAEIHFNNKGFVKAAEYYEELIKYTDHHSIQKFKYNFAFCLYNLGKFDRALKLIKDVATTDPNDRYDIREEAVRQSYVFFEGAKELNDGIEFLKEKSTDTLWVYAKYLLTKGYVVEGVKAFNELIKTLKADLDRSMKYKLEFIKIVLENSNYNAFKEITKLFRGNLTSKEISEPTKSELRTFFKNTLSELQGRYKGNDGVRKSKVYQKLISLNDFIIKFLINEDVQFQADYYYMQGDFYYDLKMWKEAYSSYKKSYEVRDRASKELINGKKQLDSQVLLIVSNKVIPSHQEILNVFEKRVKENPLKSDNIPLLNKMYDIYFDKSDYTSALKVLIALRKGYELPVGDVIGRFVKILNVYISQKDDQKINNLVNIGKKYGVELSPEVRNRVTLILGDIKFDKAFKLMNSKDYLGAITTYGALLNSALYGSEMVQKALLNIGISYFQMGNYEKSYEFILKWNTGQSTVDLSVINAIIKNLEKNIDIENQLKFSRRLVEDTCQNKTINKAPYIDSVLRYELGFSDANKYLTYLKSVEKCLTREDIVNFKKLYLDHLNISSLSSLSKEINYFWSESSLHPLIIKIIRRYYIANWDYYKIDSINTLANFLVFSTRNTEMENLVNSRKKGEIILSQLQGMDILELSYPEESFQRLISYNLQLLSSATELSDSYLKFNNPYAYRPILLKTKKLFDTFINYVENFIPPVEDDAYKTAFKQNMNELLVPLKKKRENLITLYRQTYLNNRHFSFKNMTFKSKQQLPPLFLMEEVK